MTKVRHGSSSLVIIALLAIYGVTAVVLSVSAFAASDPRNFSLSDLDTYLAGESLEIRASAPKQALAQPSALFFKSTANADLDQAVRAIVADIESTLGLSSYNILEKLSSAAAPDQQKLVQLKPQYDRLLAQHQLYLERFTQADIRLQSLSVNPIYTDKLNKQKALYLSAIEPLIQALAPLVDATEPPADEGLWSGWKRGLDERYSTYNLAQVLADLHPLLSRPAAPILRAEALPVKALDAPALQPSLDKFITPSYEQPAAPPATAEDIAASGDVVFSDLIRVKAEELGHNPIQIFEFVRNHVKTEYYAGAMKSVDTTLRQGAGNSVDQSSLLIALLRASGIPSRYVHGVVELPVEQLRSQMGIEDAKQIARALRQGGIASSVQIRGGGIAAFRVEQTWVAALVPYANYRGAVVDRSGQSWLALMPSIKTNDVVSPSGILAAADISLTNVMQEFLREVQLQSVVEVVRQKLQDYLLRTGSTDTVEQQTGSETIAAESNGYLPNSLSVPVIGVSAEAAYLVDNFRHKVKFVVYKGLEQRSEVVIDIELPLSELDNQRVTLSYMPGTLDAQNLVNGFGGLGSVPAYLIDLRAQIKVNGITRSVGKGDLPMGDSHRVELTVIGPNYRETVSKEVIAGGYHAMGISAQSVLNEGDNGSDPADTEYLAARLLSQMALRYLDQWDKADETTARLGKLALVRPMPSIVFVTNKIEVESILQQPQQFNWQGVTLDAVIRRVDAIPRSATALDLVQWRRLSALQGSYLEHALLERDFGVAGASADKVIAIARSSGANVYQLNSANLAASLPQLTHAPSVIDDISAWVARGFTVTVPATEILVDSWQGSAWIVEDLQTGAAGYFLSGGLAGGVSSIEPSNWSPTLAEVLSQPYLGEVNIDPLGAAQVFILPTTNYQQGVVDTDAEPLAVIVADQHGRRVKGAKVTFSVAAGGGDFADSNEIIVDTDATGKAEAIFTFPQRTDILPEYLLLKEGDKYASQVGMALIDVTVTGQTGVIKPAQSFVLYATPDVPTQFFNHRTGLNNLSSGGYLDSYHAGTTFVNIQDQFGNPVSNIPFTVRATTAIPAKDSVITQPHLLKATNCDGYGFMRSCGVPSVELLSTPLGQRFNVVLGESTKGALYVYKAEAQGGAIGQTYSFGASPGLAVIFTTIYHGSIKGPQNAVLAGQLYEQDMAIQMDWNPQIVVAEPKVVFNATPSGAAVSRVSIASATSTQVYYNTRLKTAPNPANNFVQAVATFRLFDQEKEDPDRQVFVATSPVAGVKLTLDPITPLAVDINTGTQAINNALTFRLDAPPSYKPSNASILVKEQNQTFYLTTASITPPTGLAYLPRGLQFDFNKEYTANAYLNLGSAFAEVKSEPLPVTFDAPIIANVWGSINAPGDEGNIRSLLFLRNEVQGVKTVDIANETVCVGGGKIRFTLLRDADITVELMDGDSDIVSSTLARNQPSRRGENLLNVQLTDLNEGYYQFKITATDYANPRVTEVALGKARIIHQYLDALPLAHATHENVDLFDGHLFLSRTDAELKGGRGIPLALVRSYSSSNTSLGAIGVGWVHNYESKIIRTGCGGVNVIGGDGGGQVFLPDGKGGFKPAKGYHGALRQTPTGYDFYSKDGTRYHYRDLFAPNANQWHLESITDTNGNTTSLAYAVSGIHVRLQKVKDSSNRSLNFEYQYIGSMSGQGPVVSRISAAGADASAPEMLFSIDYSYDSMGRLKSVTYTGEKDSNVPAGALSSRTESYAYKVESYAQADGSRNGDTYYERVALRTITDPNGNVTEYKSMVHDIAASTDPRLPTVKISGYTEIRRPENGVTRFNYSARNNRRVPLLSTVTDARSIDRVYTLNGYGAPTKIVGPSGTQEIEWDLLNDILMRSSTNENGVKTTFAYDEFGNTTSETVGTHPPSINSWYSPDQAPFSGGTIKTRLKTTTDRRGNTTKYSYDSRGNLLKIEHPQIQTVLSALGKLKAANFPQPGQVYTESFTYNAQGDRLTATDRRSKVTAYRYDALGNPNEIINAAGEKNYIQWNMLGLKVAETNARGSSINDARYRTAYSYDGLNNLVKVTYPAAPASSNQTFSYDRNGNRLTATDENGGTTKWVYDGENRVVSETNALTDTRHYTYDLLGNLQTQTGFRAGTLVTYTYDAANRQTQVAGPEDRLLNRTYDGVGNILSEYVTADRTSSYEYDDFNRKTRILDAAGGETLLAYDDNGNLIKTTDPRTHSTTYIYDELNREVERREPLGRTTGSVYDGNNNKLFVVDGNGGVTRNLYDDVNRLHQSRDAVQYQATGLLAQSPPLTFTYDAAGNVISELSRRNVLTQHSYDARNRRIQTIAKGTVDGTAQDLTSNFEYDPVGNLLAEYLPNGNVIERQYDALNRLLQLEDGLGIREAHTYDADNNPLTSTNARGYTTQFVHDKLNRLTRKTLHDQRVISSEYDLYGNLVASTDAKGKTTTYIYDKLNRQTHITDPAPFNQQIAITAYDAVGNKTVETDRRGNAVVHVYDELNRRTKTTFPELGNGESALTQTFGYDANGNLLSTIDPRGIETRHTYDANNQLTTSVRSGVKILSREYDAGGNLLFSTDANGNKSGFEYDPRNLLTVESHPLAAITNYQYDASGNQTRLRDPEGRITRRSYDLRNRMLTETKGEDSLKPDQSREETTEFRYDGNGNLLERTRPKDNSWTYDYDSSDRLISIEDAVGITAYTYDDNDNLASQTDAEGRTTRFTYDELNRRTQVEYADGAAVTTDSYDANGNLLAMTDANGLTVSYSHDALNRETLRRFAQPAGSVLADHVQSVSSRYDGNNNVIAVRETYSGGSLSTRDYAWVYDHFDRNIRYTDGFGKVLGYSYDNNGNRTRLTDPDNKVTHYGFDARNRVELVYNNQGTTRYRYLRNSQLDTISYPNLLKTQYRYDGAGRTREIHHTQNGATVSRFQYQHDTNGNRTRQAEINGAAEQITTYRYDAVDRLDQVVYPDVTTTYGYDAAYNRISERTLNNANGQVTVNKAYGYNSRHQLTDITDQLNAAQNIRYSFDANGNQLSKTQNSTTTHFIYDARDHLRRVISGGSTVGQFLYDAQGLRIEKTGDRAIERYTYDDQSVLTQMDAGNNTIAKYDYGSNRLLSLTHADEGTQFYLTDALESVVNLTNGLGTIQARYQYDAWGNKKNQVGDSWNRFGFTGHEHDSETGLIYAKARYYDPDTGRFLSQDPWEGELNTPPSLHKYLYAYMNPTVYVDPDGRQTIHSWKDEDGVTHFGDKGPKGSYGKVGDDTQLAAAMRRKDKAAEEQTQHEAYCQANSCKPVDDLIGSEKRNAIERDVAASNARNGGSIVQEDPSAPSNDLASVEDVTAYKERMARNAAILGPGLSAAQMLSGGRGSGVSGVIKSGNTIAKRLDDVPTPQGLLNTDLSKRIRNYVADVEKQTGRKLDSKQKEMLTNDLRENKYTRLSPVDVEKHRTDFNNKMKNRKLINEWEKNTGNSWPIETYVDANGLSKTRTYDAHHIIENKFGGKNEWWNIHPAKRGSEHQSGIHRKAGPANKLFGS